MSVRSLMVSQWFPPEPGPAAVPGVIARGLVDRGHDVSVLTGHPNYPTGELFDGWRQRPLTVGEFAGATVLRAPLYPSHDGSAIKRIANYVSFGVASALAYPAVRLTGKLRRPDVQWVSYSPVTVGLPQLVARWVDKVPTVIFVGDLWPDTVGVAGLDGAGKVMRLAGGVLHGWCNLLYRNAEAIIVIAPGVAKVLESRGVPAEKIHFIPVAPDEEVFRPVPADRARWNFAADRRTVVYAGAMGKAQELATLISAAAKAGDAGPEIVLAGSGTDEDSLRALATSTGAPVRFLGRIPQEDMTSLLASADAAFIGLADDPLSRITMPSKTQSILAAGRPIICCADGDVASVVGSSGAGWVSRSGDVDALADVLREFAAESGEGLARRAEAAAESHRTEFSARTVGDKTDALLRSVAAGGRFIESPAAGVTALEGFTPAEARELAELHVRSFPGFFLAQLGPAFLTRFYRGYGRDPEAQVLTYRKDGKIIGCVVGTTNPGGFYGRLLKRDFLGFGATAAIAGLRNPAAIKRILRGLTYRGGESGGEPGAALLTSICLDPEQRGSGLGGKLMQDAFRMFARAGADSVVLTTDADDNDAVNAMYSKLGGDRDHTWTTPEGRRMNRYRFDLSGVLGR